MTFTWTVDQIIALAPDASSAKAGKDLSSPRKWGALGYNGQVLWGECQGSGKNPYQTQVDLNGPAFKCSCPSRKFPCKHGLGLFLLLESQPTIFAQEAPPAWVTEWLETRTKRAEKSEQRATEQKTRTTDPDAQAKRSASREAKVRAGLQELEVWLRDLIRGGLAAAQTRPYSFWDGPAARMVDAQAPGVARILREMAGIPASGTGWQAELLRRLGQLHLLIESFKRLEQLPPATQADVRTQIGWIQSQDDLLSGSNGIESLRDHWLVLGQRVENEDRLRVQRTWLHGRDSGRAALILSFAHGSAAFEPAPVPGTSIDAELAFYPGAWPLRSLLKQQFGPPQPIHATNLGLPITEAFASYAAALSVNPWLEVMPLVLHEVRVLPGKPWKVRDSQEMELSLYETFAGNWQMLAISGGHPITIFGEWNGRSLLPLGVIAEQQWIGL